MKGGFLMNNLDTLLKKDLEDFQSYVQSNYRELSDNPVSSGDLAEFGKQLFYTLDAFREHIVDAINNL
jgi:hypothetical protein